jgi:DNA-binding transcriptional LysR family regulator
MNLEGLDLNLLIALEALLRERNVTRAAERINISQPGMSAALQKLRRHFSDPLLERVGRDMQLTARARELAEPVQSILSQVRELSERSRRFDPLSAERVFRVAATTYCCELLATALISRLRTVAPRISVQFVELAVDTADLVFDGQIDFAITISADFIKRRQADNTHLKSKELFNDEFVVAIAKDNRCVGDSLSFDELCDMNYVETRFGGTIVGISEQLWRQQRRQPRVLGWLPNFHLTLDAISQTDMATILPSLLVAQRGKRYHVRSLPVPFDMPVLEERLYWHRRNDKDPGHVWMAEAINEVVLDLGLTNAQRLQQPAASRMRAVISRA